MPESAQFLVENVQYGLAPGTPITLSPEGAPAAVCLAEVLAWSTSPSGLVVTARAATDPASAGELDNRNVFVSGRTADDELIVLEAVARQSPERTGILELVSVAALAREHRRAAVRAAVAFPIVLSVAEPAGATETAAGVSGTTIDLSCDGCRLRLDTDLPLAVGTLIGIDLGLPTPIRVTGTVVRATGGTREIILSFDPLSAADATAVDAVVYAALRA